MSIIASRPEDFPGIRVEEAGETCSVFIDPMRLFAGEIGIRSLERELNLPPRRSVAACRTGVRAGPGSTDRDPGS